MFQSQRKLSVLLSLAATQSSLYTLKALSSVHLVHAEAFVLIFHHSAAEHGFMGCCLYPCLLLFVRTQTHIGFFCSCYQISYHTTHCITQHFCYGKLFRSDFRAAPITYTNTVDVKLRCFVISAFALSLFFVVVFFLMLLFANVWKWFIHPAKH